MRKLRFQYKWNARHLEDGFRQEVRKLREQHPELTFFTCRMMVLDDFEIDVVLTEKDKEWVKNKRKQIVSQRDDRLGKSARVPDSLDALLDEL